MTLPKRSEGPPSGLPSWARVGARVICIDDVPDAGKSFPDYMPTKGDICVIAGFSASGYRDEPTLVIEGHPNWCAIHRREVGYFVRRFRPLITLEADLEAHFSQLLHVPSTHTVDA